MKEMSLDRSRLRALVDGLPDNDVPVRSLCLAELSEEETADAQTAAKLDRARAEPGEDIPWEEVRRRSGL